MKTGIKRIVRPTKDEKLPPMPGEKEPRYNPFELNKEQFLFLASHRPEILIDSVYEVRAYNVKPDFDGCSPQLPEHYVRSFKHYGNFRLSLEPTGVTYYSSIEKAWAEMKNITGIQIGWEVHSVIIRRIPLDRYRNAPWLEWWLFNGMGKLMSRSVCTPYFDIQHEYISGRYMGRRETDLKFNVGDFVEVIYVDNYPHVMVGMIDKCPENPEEVWENYQVRRAEAKANPEDFYEQEDYYDAIDFPGEDEDRFQVLFPDGSIGFIEPWRITYPTRPITDEIKKAFGHVIGKTPKFH